jgi:hypothetical protein
MWLYTSSKSEDINADLTFAAEVAHGENLLPIME